MMIELPWPLPELSPNARPHWATKARAVAKSRAWAYAATKAAVGRWKPVDGIINLSWTFYPPNRHKRDDDNLGSSVKSYRDGIAEALGIDDNRFRVTSITIGEPVKGGKVVVVLS